MSFEDLIISFHKIVYEIASNLKFYLDSFDVFVFAWVECDSGYRRGVPASFLVSELGSIEIE